MQNYVRNLSNFIAVLSLLWLFSTTSKATSHEESTLQEVQPSLSTLSNYQQNNAFMMSSGLPEPAHFALLKDKGVTHVIDLIPGDRSDEINSTADVALTYFNVPVDWEAPSLNNFLNYAAFMQRVDTENEKVLTHCKLNWRGASFTYLYRVAVLGESETKAKSDLMAIWHPNPTWYAFMSDVITHFNRLNNTNISMSFQAAPIEHEH